MTTNRTPEENLPYIAGLFDSSKGEISETGWIYFHHENKRLIDFLEEKVGGAAMKYSDTGNYIWFLDGDKSQDLLTRLLPFLIRNKDVAKIALGLS